MDRIQNLVSNADGSVTIETLLGEFITIENPIEPIDEMAEELVGTPIWIGSDAVHLGMVEWARIVSPGRARIKTKPQVCS